MAFSCKNVSPHVEYHKMDRSEVYHGMPRHIIHIYIYIYCQMSFKHEDSDNPSLDRNNNTMMKIMEVATKDCQVCQAKPILKSFEPHYDCKQRDHRCRKTCCCTSSSCAAVRLEGDFTIPPPTISQNITNKLP